MNKKRKVELLYNLVRIPVCIIILPIRMINIVTVQIIEFVCKKISETEEPFVTYSMNGGYRLIIYGNDGRCSICGIDRIDVLAVK